MLTEQNLQRINQWQSNNSHTKYVYLFRHCNYKRDS